jgi:hypothetical protein
MTYLFCIMLPALVLTGLAQWYLRSTYNTWKQRRNSQNVTGRQAAEMIMKRYGLRLNGINIIDQELGDHYDPRDQTVGMSQDIAMRPSVASMAVAAHEFGHVQQYAENSPLIVARGFILPVAQIGSGIAPWLIIGGLLVNFTAISWLGLILFGAAVVFSVLTLPVEFDASRRGLKMLEEVGLIQTADDRSGARAVLRAAALTYVAATAVAVLNLAYYAMLLLGRRD